MLDEANYIIYFFILFLIFNINRSILLYELKVIRVVWNWISFIVFFFLCIFGIISNYINIICFFGIFFILNIGENMMLYELEAINSVYVKNKSNSYLDRFIWFVKNYWVALYWTCFIFFSVCIILKILPKEDVYLIYFFLLFFVFIIGKTIRLYELKVIRVINKSNRYLDWFFDYLWVILYLLFIFFCLYIYFFGIMLKEEFYIICFLVLLFVFNISRVIRLYQLKVVRVANKSNSYFYLFIDYLWFLEYYWVGLYWICFIVFFFLCIFGIISNYIIYIICFLAVFFILNISENMILYELKVDDNIDDINKSNSYLNLFILFFKNFLVVWNWICFIFVCIGMYFF